MRAGNFIGRCIVGCDIVSLDLENEKPGLVEQPRGTLLRHAIDGCLCCLCPSSNEPNHFDYWLLKEYGAKGSWYKFATLPRIDKPLLVGPEGEILGWRNFSLSIFSKGDVRSLRRSLYNSNTIQIHRTVMYGESLFEP